MRKYIPLPIALLILIAVPSWAAASHRHHHGHAHRLAAAVHGSKTSYCDRHPNRRRCTASPTPSATGTSAVAPTTTTADPTPTPTQDPATTSPAPTVAPTTAAPTTAAPTTAAPTPSTSGSPTPTPSTSGSPTSSTTSTATGAVCTNPALVFDGQGSQGLGAYYADADIWNPAPGMSQTMGVCSHGSWYTDDYVPTNLDQSSVKAYPNVHYDFHDWGTGYEPAISSFNTITGTYAGTSSGVGTYDVAWDIWINGVGGNANELMIWTDNRNQTPSGSVVARNITVSGKTWDLWATSDNSYVAFVPANGAAYPSGTLDLKAFMTYLMQDGRYSKTSTLGQVDYGIEVCSTAGQHSRFDVTDFSVTTN